GRGNREWGSDPFPFGVVRHAGGRNAVDAETRNRYRLRWREAVRGPSAPRALLASVRMTDWASVARFGQDDKKDWMRSFGTGTGFAGAKLSEVLPLRERCSLRSG